MEENDRQMKLLTRDERRDAAVDVVYVQHGYVSEEGGITAKDKVANVLYGPVSKAIANKPAERENALISRTRLVELAFPQVPGRTEWHEQEDPELAEDVYKELMRRTWTICSENPKGPLQSRLNGDVGLVLVQYMPSQHGIEGGVYVTRDYKSLEADVIKPARKKQEAFARRQAFFAEMLMERVPEHAKKFQRDYVTGLQTGANIAKELIGQKLASLEENNSEDEYPQAKEGLRFGSPSLTDLEELVRVENEAMLADKKQIDETTLARARRIGGYLRQARGQFPARGGGWYEWLKKALPDRHPHTAAIWMQLADPANHVSTRRCSDIEEALRVIRGPRKRKSTSEPKAQKAKPTLAGKRMHTAKVGRNTAKRNGREVAFWELGWEVSRLVYGLAGWHVETIPLDEDNRHAMQTVEEDLLYLYDWMDDTLAFIHSRMGEDGMRRQLEKLRAKTVENGCTPEEADTADRAAKRLERKINNVLVAAA